ncbi:MAG: HNH endonuclease signature motif containing protein, partial [Gaiellaceae bacterium]
EGKYVVDEATGCWLWTGTKHGHGYGIIKHGPAASRRSLRAHRVAYELFVGPIPEGLELDHLCRVRHCVNPAHLEPVTTRENLLRGETLTARHAAKTHCDNGHEYTPENTRVSARGWRDCRTCSCERSMASYRRNRESRLAAKRARHAEGRHA